mgnify:FL=1
MLFRSQIGENKSKVIVFFTDVFGYSFVNAQRLADCFHNETGATVLIPDYFQNDPIDPNIEDLFSILPDWLNKHPPSDACRIGQQFISTIQQQYQTIQVLFSFSFLFFHFRKQLLDFVDYWLLLWSKSCC